MSWEPLPARGGIQHGGVADIYSNAGGSSRRARTRLVHEGCMRVKGIFVFGLLTVLSIALVAGMRDAMAAPASAPASAPTAEGTKPQAAAAAAATARKIDFNRDV